MYPNFFSTEPRAFGFETTPGQRRRLSITGSVEDSTEILAAVAPEQRFLAIQVFELLPTFWRKGSGSILENADGKTSPAF